MERRKFQRIFMDRLSVDVFDGTRVFAGFVSDISRSGMCLSELPSRIEGNVPKLTVVVSGDRDHFRMNVRPRWFTNGGNEKSIGVEILNSPLGWTEFVMRREPTIDKDLWGGIRL